MFWTLQSRLPTLLRLSGVTTIEQANEYLKNYLPKFNKQFALDYTRMQSVFENKPSKEKVNLTLAVLTKRTVDGGHSVRFDKKYYRTVNQRGFPIYFYKGTEGLVIQAFDKSLYFCVDKRSLRWKKYRNMNSHQEISTLKSPQKPCVKYIPR